MPHPPTSVVVRTNERGPSIQVKEGASEAHERDSQINTGLKSKFYFKKDSVISLGHELHQSCLAKNFNFSRLVALCFKVSLSSKSL